MCEYMQPYILVQRRLCRERNLSQISISSPKYVTSGAEVVGQILNSAPGRGVFAFDTPTELDYTKNNFGKNLLWIFWEEGGFGNNFLGEIWRKFCFASIWHRWGY